MTHKCCRTTYGSHGHDEIKPPWLIGMSRDGVQQDRESIEHRGQTEFHLQLDRPSGGDLRTHDTSCPYPQLLTNVREQPSWHRVLRMRRKQSSFSRRSNCRTTALCGSEYLCPSCVHDPLLCCAELSTHLELAHHFFLELSCGFFAGAVYMDYDVERITTCIRRYDTIRKYGRSQRHTNRLRSFLTDTHIHQPTLCKSSHTRAGIR